MDDETWAKLPATSNAEEALHFTLYKAIGKKLGLSEDLEGLYNFADFLLSNSIATHQGTLVYYGDRERAWKKNAEEYGRTKLTQNRKKTIPNDGRPPDTAKVLMNGKITTSFLPGYPWRDNSCWLDTSLELLYRAFSPVNQQLREALGKINSSTVIGTLYYALSEHYLMEGGGNTEYSSLLSAKRDQFRTLLLDKKILHTKDDKHSSSSLFGWLDGSIGEYHQTYTDSTVFDIGILNIHTCFSENSIQHHSRISKHTRRRGCISLNYTKHTEFQGSLQKWFQHTMSSPVEDHITCWKNTSSGSCQGKATIATIWISLPSILIIEFESLNGEVITWNTPKVLQGGSEFQGIQYNLIGKGHYNPTSHHFTASFLNNQHMYEYDGMKNSGYSIRISKGSLFTHGQDYLSSHITAVIYILENSKAAQESFTKVKVEWIHQYYHLLSDPSQSGPIKFIPDTSLCSILPHSERIWMKDPYSAKFIDYTGKQTLLSSTPKKTRFKSIQSDKNSQTGLEDNSTSKIPIKPSQYHQKLVVEDDASITTSPHKNNLRQENSLDSLSKASITSEFPINCHCGFQGDGYSQTIEEGCVECWHCKQWSHIACQYDGQASKLSAIARFSCHNCNITQL